MRRSWAFLGLVTWAAGCGSISEDRIQLDRARFMVDEGFYGRALDLYARVARQDPSNREAAFGVAEIVRLQGRFDRAHALYGALMEEAPSEAAVLGWLWTGCQADSSKTQDLCKQAQSRLPGSAAVATLAGRCLAETGEFAAAEAALRRALALDSGLSATHAELSRVLDQRGLTREASAEASVAARLLPQDAALQAWAGDRLLRAGLPEEAIPFLESAAALGPEDRGEIWLKLGHARHAMGDHRGALAAFWRAEDYGVARLEFREAKAAALLTLLAAKGGKTPSPAVSTPKMPDPRPTESAERTEGGR